MPRFDILPRIARSSRKLVRLEGSTVSKNAPRDARELVGKGDGKPLSRELRAMGYRKLSARPRHHAQPEGVGRGF